MENKKSTYLYERSYRLTGEIKSNETLIDQRKLKFWNESLGSSFFERLYSSIPEVYAYLTNQEYKLHKFRKEISDTCKEYRVEEIVSNFMIGQQKENFISFYKPYLAEGLSELLSKINDCSFCTQQIYKDYLRVLLAKLEKICIRILIYEIQSYKSMDKLQGTGAREQYLYFCEEIISPAWQNRVEEKYPLLKRSVREVIHSSAELYSDALNRLQENKKEIEEKLCAGKVFLQVTGIEGNLSDSHRGGKGVLKFCLDNGVRVIYKPHDVRNEELFDELAERIGKECGLSMHTIPRVAGDDYGWVACVKNRDCNTEEEVCRFYRRMGIYIFVFYLLGTNDIHGENIIACGEYPVIVDMENILGMPDDIKCSTIMEKMKLFLHTSVLYSGVLPGFKWQKQGGNANISGIGGKGNSKMSFKIPGIANGGTSDIRIQYVYPEIKPDDNVPRRDGKQMNPSHYKYWVADGFRCAYVWAMEHTDQTHLLIQGLDQVESRYLTADTQRYAMCLNSSYHPALMRDGAERQIFLYTMWYGRDMNSPKEKEMVESEIRDLLKHDIPYFYFHSSGRHLYDSKEKAIENYFSCSAYEILLRKLKKLNKEDLMHQIDLIDITLTMQEQTGDTMMNRSMISPEYVQESRDTEKDEYLRIAIKIADFALEKAVKCGKDIGWYLVNVASFGNSGWQIEPVSMYLYGGVMGIALFYHMIYHCAKLEKYRDVCRNLDEQLFTYTGEMEGRKSGRMRTGIYNGETSIVYGYLCIYRITKDIRYLEYAVRHAEFVIEAIDNEEGCDLLEGLAGAVWGMVMLYEVKGEEKYLKAAEKAGDRLWQRARVIGDGVGWSTQIEEQPLLGMAHGNAGIMTALAKLYHITKEERYYALLKKALVYEDNYYREELGNWLDFRIKDEKERDGMDTVAWCHGAGGILVSRLMIYEWVKDDIRGSVENDIQKAGRKLGGEALRKGMCLCHGSCGNLLMFMDYVKFSKWQRDLRMEEWFGRYILHRLRKDGFELLLQEKNNPGLMSGYLGIAYYMLKKYDKGMINILKLE